MRQHFLIEKTTKPAFRDTEESRHLQCEQQCKIVRNHTRLIVEALRPQTEQHLSEENKS